MDKERKKELAEQFNIYREIVKEDFSMFGKYDKYVVWFFVLCLAWMIISSTIMLVSGPEFQTRQELHRQGEEARGIQERLETIETYLEESHEKKKHKRGTCLGFCG